MQTRIVLVLVLIGNVILFNCMIIV